MKINWRKEGEFLVGIFFGVVFFSPFLALLINVFLIRTGLIVVSK